MTFQSPKNKSSASSSPTMLGPGFRFHPTDEELVQYYLRRKAAGKLLRFDAISEIDIYKTEPWDLPHMSKMKTRDLEWYFFSMLDKKYGNGARTNRATEKGYWKTTGKDRAVYNKKQVVGMKKTLVYHNGRAPKGQRTNWVMHEYRLVDNELETARTSQDAFVICRVFQKSGSGPKNGEQYGAPFVEEEWNDDDLELVPENEVTQEVDFDSDAWLDYHDLQQILGSDMLSSSTPISVNFQSGDGNDVETAESSHNMPTHLMTVGNQYGEPKLCGSDMNINNCPPYDADVNLVNEHIGGCSKSEALGDTAYLLLDEPFLDSSDNLEFLNGGFIEASDISKAIENDYTASDMLDEYLTFFDADDNNSLSFTWDIQGMDNGTEQAALPNGPHIENSIDNKPDAAVSSEKQDLAKYESGFQCPFIKKASHMLGSTAAPSAFAAEYPSEEMIDRLNFLLEASSSSYQVTSSMVQIRNLNTGSASGKQENLDILLSFGFSRDSNDSILPGKMVSTISRGWFCYAFFWVVLILYMSFEIRAYIRAH